MKSYTITVNGTSYDVTVEEKGSVSTPAATLVRGAAAPAPAAVPTPTATAPAAAPAPTVAAAPAPAPAAGGTGSIPVEAGAAGKVFQIEAQPGAQMKLGETILILEIMKMETPVVAPQDGTLASINVKEGQSVEAGELLATMNA